MTLTKKLLAALLAACLCAALFVGCSSRDDASEAEPGASEQESEPEAVDPTNATSQQAAEHNKELADEDVSLVQFSAVGVSDPVAVIKTTEGEIRIRLFPTQAPKAVENFTKLASSGYFNGLTFQEVVGDNYIRGGAPEGSEGVSSFSTGESDPGYFEDEISLDLWHFRGAVSMWNTGADKNTSQFIIVQSPSISAGRLSEMKQINYPEKVLAKYEEVGGLPGKDTKYTVFGMVADEASFAVVDKIAAVAVEDEDAGKYTPVEPVLIESVTIEG